MPKLNSSEEVAAAVAGLTALEDRAWQAFALVARGSGYDFAFSDEVAAEAKALGIGKAQLGALLVNLAAKGLIYLDAEGERINGSGPRLYQHSYPEVVRDYVAGLGHAA